MCKWLSNNKDLYIYKYMTIQKILEFVLWRSENLYQWTYLHMLGKEHYEDIIFLY